MTGGLSTWLDVPPVYAVPAVHYRPWFAGRALHRLEDVRPTAVALDLPPTAIEPLITAVHRLPRLSILVGSDEVIPVVPTDAMVEVVRFAIARGLPVHGIDLRAPDEEALGAHDPQRHFSPVSHDLEGWARARRDAPSEWGSHNSVLEQNLAAGLRNLAVAPERVLFVCGAARWAGVRHHLLKGSPAPRAKLEPRRYGLAHLTAPAAAGMTGVAPYVLSAYQACNDRADFDEYFALMQLYEEAGASSGRRLGALDLQLLGHYAKNLAHVAQDPTPDLLFTVLSAQANLSDEYAIAVLDRAMRYQKNKSQKGYAVVDWEAGARPEIDGMPLPDLPVRGRVRAPAEWGLTLQPKAPHHPRGDAFGATVPESDNFGRYRAEMLAEERFFARLARVAITRPDERETTSEPFSSGLRDGIDVKRTLRDPERALWVKTLDPGPGEAGAVLIEYDEMPEGDGAHTYGAHRGIGMYRWVEEANPGVWLCEWTCLLSFLRRLSVDALLTLARSFYDAGESVDVLRRFAIEHATAPVVVFVSRRPPSDAERAFAAEQRRRLIHLSFEQLSSEEMEAARRHHVYFYE